MQAKLKVPKIHINMRIHDLILLLASAAAVGILTGCATLKQPPPEPLTVPQIISMAKQKIPADDIIAEMRLSRTVYRLKASRLADLEKMGVPAKVIDYMQQTYIHALKEEARRDEARFWPMEDEYCWYGGPPYGWPCDDCFE